MCLKHDDAYDVVCLKPQDAYNGHSHDEGGAALHPSAWPQFWRATVTVSIALARFPALAIALARVALARVALARVVLAGEKHGVFSDESVVVCLFVRLFVSFYD